METIDNIKPVLSEFSESQSQLLPIFHKLQHEIGYIPLDALPEIASKLNLSRAEVYGVLSFYKDFRTSPPAKHHIQICQGESCQAQGANEIGEKLLAELGLKWGEKSQDGQYEIEKIFCLGLCSCGPAAMVNGELKARIDENCIFGGEK